MPSRPLPFPTPPSGLSLGGVLQRLAVLAPDDLAALETLARACLAERWPDIGSRPLKARSKAAGVTGKDRAKPFSTE